MLTPTMRLHMSGACLACSVSGCCFALLVGGDPLSGAILGTLIYAVIVVLSLPAKVRKPTKDGIVVISSASSGIGFAAAVKLASLGFNVFGGVHKISDGDSLREHGCMPLLLDVASEESVANARLQVAEWAHAHDHKVVALVNSAEVRSTCLPLELETQDNMDFVMQVNVFGVIRMYRHFLPLLREFGAGARVVNIGSVAGQISAPLMLGFTMSKHSLQAITGVSRAELSRFGMTVSVVNTGATRTPLADKSATRNVAQLRKLRKSHPPEMHRLYPAVLNEQQQRRLAARTANALQHCPTPNATTTPAIVHAICSARPRPYYFVGVLSPSYRFVSATFGTWLYWSLPIAVTARWAETRDKVSKKKMS